MTLDNADDLFYCINDFTFVLKSAQLSDSFATMFEFRDPGDPELNPTIKLIA